MSEEDNNFDDDFDDEEFDEEGEDEFGDEEEGAKLYMTPRLYNWLWMWRLHDISGNHKPS